MELIIKWGAEGHKIVCVDRKHVDTDYSDYVPIMKKYQNDRKLLADNPEIVKHFKKMQLIGKSGNVTDAGRNFIESGRAMMGEFGIDDILYIDNRWISEDNEVLLFKRTPYSEIKIDYKDSAEWVSHKQSISANSNCVEVSNGKQTVVTVDKIDVLAKKCNSDQTIELKCESKYLQDKGWETSIVGTLNPDKEGKAVDFNVIKVLLIDEVGLINSMDLGRYDSNTKKIILSSISEISDKELTSLVKSFNKKDVVFDGHDIKEILLKDVGICAENERVEREWINRLMRIEWKDKYVTAEQSEADQEFWYNAIHKDSVVSGYNIPATDELIESLKGSLVYWNVASAADIRPNNVHVRSQMNMIKGVNVLDKVRNNLVPKDIRGSIRKVIVEDSYPNDYTANIIEAIFKDALGECPATVIKGNFEKVDVGRLNDKSPDWLKYEKIDKRAERKIHDRIITIHTNDGKVIRWGMTNGLDHLRLEGKQLTPTDDFKIFPIYNTLE